MMHWTQSDCAIRLEDKVNIFDIEGIYTFAFNNCKKGNRSTRRLNVVSYPRTDLSFCPACHVFKSPRFFNFSRGYCKKCTYSTAKLFKRCGEFINDHEDKKKKSGLCLALRKLMTMLDWLDFCVSISQEKMNESIVDNEIHLSLCHKTDLAFEMTRRGRSFRDFLCPPSVNQAKPFPLSLIDTDGYISI